MVREFVLMLLLLTVQPCEIHCNRHEFKLTAATDFNGRINNKLFKSLLSSQQSIWYKQYLVIYLK